MRPKTKGECILDIAARAGSYTASNISMRRAADNMVRRKYLAQDRRNEKVFFITEKGLDWLGNGV